MCQTAALIWLQNVCAYTKSAGALMADVVAPIASAAHIRLARFAQPVFCDVARVIITWRAAQAQNVSPSVAGVCPQVHATAW